MPHAGSQVILCGLPVHFDTYKGCSHGCKYCFTTRKTDISKLGDGEGVEAIRRFIEGRRTQETNWCDWNIPLHWGAMSDPFQPIELERGNSKRILELFAETKYPFVVSTKGAAIIRPDYIALLKRCNVVVQVSAVCDKYDRIEPGAPTFRERLEIIRVLSKSVTRVNVRVQPYIPDVRDDVLNVLPLFSSSGVHGVILEGMKGITKQAGMIKLGGDMVYPVSTLVNHFTAIKKEAHRLGMKFYCGENRLRSMSDELTCCGIEGLAGFKGNDYNICSIMNGSNAKPTRAMMEPNTALCFKGMFQRTVKCNAIKRHPFASAMNAYMRSRLQKCIAMFSGFSNADT